MVFQDSDVAKWLEAAAYSLALKPDASLEARVDEVVALIGRCQHPDGYLNTYFTVREPENRWANLLECHELYCAAHLIEAGVALHGALGKEELLHTCLRLADHICDRFLQAEGILRHQEIELALMRLYHATGTTRYRDMALRFLDRRGQDPGWFAKHTAKHPGAHYGGYDILAEDTAYNQSDVPVREQTVARGHAVRQMYMLTAMADAAAETGDARMQAACERLFDNITQRQMYVTGAVGATPHHESFTVDYDLPSDRCYGETCASVAMAFFAHAMLGLGARGCYADLQELEVYNAALAGMQMDGKRFFYVNPLTVDRSVSGAVPGYEHVLAQRPAWHACACCPPNLARGPLIYCIEDADHPAGVSSMVLPEDAILRADMCPTGPLRGMMLLHAEAKAQIPPETLYTAETPRYQPCALTAIPSFAWGNRAGGDMRVWIRSQSARNA